MPWGSLGTTDWVSFTNAQGAGLYLRPGQSAVSSDDWMQKIELTTKYFVNESNSFLSPKAAADWVAKRDITVVTPIYLQIASSYDGSFGLTIQVFVTGTLPAAATLSFNWCTNTTADGDITFSLPSGFSGGTDALANLSMTGSFSGTYASGNVTTWDTGIVNDMNVKAPSISFSTSDTTSPHLISYPSVDNACSSPTTVVDECIENCS